MTDSLRRARRALPALLASLGLAACVEVPTTVESAAPAVARVVLVSVDGLRGDALARMPRLSALAAGGLAGDSVRSVTPSLTVPGHLSMLSGRDVTQFGIRDNALGAENALRFVMSGSTTVFQWVRADGRRTEAVAGAALLGTTTAADAQRFFAVDTMVAAEANADDVTARALARLDVAAPAALLFVHYADVDLTGHESGWIVPGLAGDSLSPAYVAAARRVDAAIGRLADRLAAQIAAGEVALVVTADHGGGHGEGCVAGVPAYREHCTDAPGDELVPFVLVAHGVAPGRLSSGARLTQVAPTVAALLRAPATASVDRALF